MINFFSLITGLALTTFVVGQEVTADGWTPETKQKLLDQIAENELAREIYGRVFNQLENQNIPPEFLEGSFNHPDIDIDDGIIRRFHRPAEKLSYERYRKIFVTDQRIKEGVKFYNQNKALIDTVYAEFGVDPFLLVSLAGVESKYGTHAKTHLVFVALHTVIHKLPRREKWVEKEMAEFLSYCYENNVPPLSLGGSYAGAFGYGQFIPSSFRGYAVDFDGDGVREPFDWPDVLASMANYLVKNGYAKGSDNFSKDSPNWKSVYSYNPALNYVKVVLELREAISAAEN